LNTDVTLGVSPLITAAPRAKSLMQDLFTHN